MKIRHALLATVVAILSSATMAQAAIIDNLHTVSDGIYGPTSDTATSGLTAELYSGILPTHTEITFFYTFTNLAGAMLFDSGSHGAQSSISSALGSSSSTSTTLGSLILTEAFLGNGVAEATIINESTHNANFSSLFAGLLTRGGNVTVSYDVTAAPLPATATLFGLGLAMLAGIGMMKRKEQQA